MSLAQDAGRLLDALTQPLRVQAAFMALFQFIENSPNGKFGWIPLGDDAVRGRDYAREVHLWRDRIRTNIGREEPFGASTHIAGLGSALEEIVKDGCIARQNSKALVMALLVFDDAFQGVHPGEVVSATDALGFVEMRTRIRKGEACFQLDGLRAYPKPRRLVHQEVRGQGRLTDLLVNIAVVQSGSDLEVVNLIAFDDGSFGPKGFTRIGIIPTIDSHEELAWKKENHRRYSIAEELGTCTRVHARVRDALALLIAEGAELVLMPELVASPALVRVVADALATARHAGKCTPHLMLVGTQLVNDGDKTRNRACVVDAEGETVWEQDKLHAYRFSALDQARCGHPMGADELVDRTEAIDVEPRTLYVVDLSATQRVTILTCEDFIQPDPHRSIVADIVATTILVPIMSGHRNGPNVGWIQDAAVNYVRRPGATCVIANSGALLGTRREGWQYGHVMAEPRVACDWKSLPDETTPIAWLADLGREV